MSALLAYAPIAAGVLTGKYLDTMPSPKGARNTLWPSNTRYFSEQAIAATRAYIELAGEIGVAPEVLAHAFVLDQKVFDCLDCRRHPNLAS